MTETPFKRITSVTKSLSCALSVTNSPQYNQRTSVQQIVQDIDRESALNCINCLWARLYRILVQYVVYCSTSQTLSEWNERALV